MSPSGERRPWSDEEVASFYEGLVHHHKRFDRIAGHVGTRTAAECVEYYYLWKNVCREECQSFKAIFAAAAPQVDQQQAEEEEEETVDTSESSRNDGERVEGCQDHGKGAPAQE